MKIQEVEQRLGVQCTDNTLTYFGEGVQLVGLTDRMKVFCIEDPIANPNGYGFEIMIDLEKKTFKFVYDSCGINLKENRLAELSREIYQEAVELMH
jgi:hypothetical protein